MIPRIALESAAAALLNRSQARAPAVSSPTFTGLFEEVLAPVSGVRLSAHAADRLGRRQIQLSSSQEGRLGDAVDHAAAKGARESLLLMDQVAYVVNVRNRTVITAVPVGEYEPAIFTNIDSAVVVPAEPALP